MIGSSVMEQLMKTLLLNIVDYEKTDLIWLTEIMLIIIALRRRYTIHLIQINY